MTFRGRNFNQIQIPVPCASEIDWPNADPSLHKLLAVIGLPLQGLAGLDQLCGVPCQFKEMGSKDNL